MKNLLFFSALLLLANFQPAYATGSDDWTTIVENPSKWFTTFSTQYCDQNEMIIHSPSLTESSFILKDESGKTLATATKSRFSHKIQVLDEHNQALGHIKRVPIGLMGIEVFLVLDSQENPKLVIEKMDHTIRFRDLDDNIIGTLHQKKDAQGTTWSYPTSLHGKIDRRLILFLGPYLTQSEYHQKQFMVALFGVGLAAIPYVGYEAYRQLSEPAQADHPLLAWYRAIADSNVKLPPQFLGEAVVKEMESITKIISDKKTPEDELKLNLLIGSINEFRDSFFATAKNMAKGKLEKSEFPTLEAFSQEVRAHFRAQFDAGLQQVLDTYRYDISKKIHKNDSVYVDSFVEKLLAIKK